MDEKQKLSPELEKIIEEVAADLMIPKDQLLVHVTRSTTQEDWDNLDPDSWGANCSSPDCGHYTVGKLPPKDATEEEAQKVFKCEKCGGDVNGMETPAYASTLAMRDPAYWDM
jgi:hypothetical protein